MVVKDCFPAAGLRSLIMYQFMVCSQYMDENMMDEQVDEYILDEFTVDESKWM
jgi:hypothetical protein